MILRNDTGGLWENFCILERKKINHNKRKFVNTYFWRTYDQQEIDLVEERGEALSAYEMKWKSQKQNPPKAWLKSYPQSTYQVICPDNYHGFVGIG